MNQLPTPPFYNYSPNKKITKELYSEELEKERTITKRLNELKKYILSIGGIALICIGIFVIFICYIHMNWFISHPFIFIIVLLCIINAIYQLITPFEESEYHENEIIECSDEDKQQAIERAELANKHFKKLIEKDYPIKYCIHCHHFIPQQTYHCLICNKCISKRDHHCTWLGICIGEKNLRRFWQLLFSLFIVSLIGLIHFICFWIHTFFVSSFISESLIVSILVYYFTFIFTLIALSLTGAMMYMLYIHTRDLLLGLTGIEIGEMNTRILHGEDVHPPSMKFKNFTNVMGSTPLHWILPLKVK